MMMTHDTSHSNHHTHQEKLRSMGYKVNKTASIERK